MTEREFATEMARLSDTFGAQHYKAERAKLIWAEVRSFSAAWFHRVVSDLIGSMRFAPLVADFAPFVTQERERSWQEQKRQGSRDASAFWDRTTFGNDEVKSMADAIRKRARGEMSDDEWRCFVQMLENATRSA